MAEELPDGTRGGYEGYCPECHQTIKTNIQGNETGHHYCNMSSRIVLASILDDLNYLSEKQKLPEWIKDKMVGIKKHLAIPEKV